MHATAKINDCKFAVWKLAMDNTAWMTHACQQGLMMHIQVNIHVNIQMQSGKGTQAVAPEEPRRAPEA
jgi:hypothetical protein